MGWKFPEIPRPHPVVHLHYLAHFGASSNKFFFFTWYGMKILKKQKKKTEFLDILKKSVLGHYLIRANSVILIIFE